MKKIRKLIPVLVCSFLVAGSGVAIAQSLHSATSNEVKATTTELFLSVGRTNNKGGIYVNGDENDLPYSGSWTCRYYPTEASCIKVDGVSVATKLYPGSQGDNQSLTKFDTDRYYFDFSSSAVQNPLATNSKITFGGVWGSTIEEVEYLFTLTDIKLVWDGYRFVPDMDAYDLEDYDRFTLRDAGIFEFEQVEMGTEDAGCLAYNSWEASEDNIHCNFEFLFELQSYDPDSTPEFCLRMGANPYWDVGHYFQFNFFVQENDCITIGEWESGTRLWHSGDVPVTIGGETHVFGVGNVRIRNTNTQLTYFMVDGSLLYGTVHGIPTETALTTHVGLYHPGTDMSMRNAWPQDLGTLPTQTPTADVELGGPNGIYFALPENSGAYSHEDWSYRYYPTERGNLLKNGAEFISWKQNLLVKFTATRYYVALGDWGYGDQPVGTVITIGGVFRRTADGVSTYIYIDPTSFILRADGWHLYAFADLTPSTEGDINEGDLLTNIGKWTPDHSRNAVKGFDQTADSLVFKEDKNGNTGVCFTSGDENSHGEFRVYLPGNGYKSESKGYAMTRLTFDYIMEDSGAATETSRNHGLTTDGYYVPAPGASTNKFTVQVLCHSASNMYYDRDVELICDGAQHTVTFDVAYGDVMGFCFVLWNFEGQFFMSNCRANYLEYNQALNELVYQSLKMYDYVADEEQCLSLYAGAKAAYEALTVEEKALFNHEDAYASARARLSAWASANGETFDATTGTFTSNTHNFNNLDKNNTIAISIVIGAIALISIVGVVLTIRKRKYSK